MNYRLFKIITALSLLPFLGNAYSQEWIALSNEQKGEIVSMEVLEDNLSAYKVRYRINGINDYPITNERGEFHRISLDNDNNISVIGAPSLPLVNRFVAIPESANISVSIVEGKWTEIEIGKIYPVQRPTLENEKATDFVINEKAYQEIFAPQQILMGKEKEWRGIRCINLSICPFLYNPTLGRLSVMYEFVLQINFLKDVLPLQTKKVYENADPFHMFDNHIFLDSSIGHRNAPEGDLLIIVGDNLGTIKESRKMEEFRLWKAFKGIKSRLVYCSVTGGGEENIKNFIFQQYSDGVRYVLFVGDETQIPVMDLVSLYPPEYRYLSGDYWYGCLGGEDDIIADVAIGRFSTNQLNEFSNMVDKTIKYEKSLYPLNEALLVAYYCDDYNNNYRACCNSIRDTTYSDPIVFSCAYGDSATNNDIIQRINAGVNIINYRGHGGTDVWGKENEWSIIRWNFANEEFYSSQINNMSSETCSIILSIACKTGSIQYNSPCMLETFTRSPHGAVAFLGATTDTYPRVNNSLNKELYIKLLNDSIYRIGDVINSAHARCLEQFDVNDTIANENPFCYLLGGDPTLEIWTKAPQTINNVYFNIVGDSVYITFDPICNDSSYCALVRAEDGTLISNIINNGHSFRFPKPEYNFYAVINSHNYHPYIIYCDFDTEELVNKVVKNEEHYYWSPFFILDGSLLGASEYTGVVIKDGGKLVIHKGADGVKIYNGLECEQGAEFEIK